MNLPQSWKQYLYVWPIYRTTSGINLTQPFSSQNMICAFSCLMQLGVLQSMKIWFFVSHLRQTSWTGKLEISLPLPEECHRFQHPRKVCSADHNESILRTKWDLLLGRQCEKSLGSGWFNSLESRLLLFIFTKKCRTLNKKNPSYRIANFTTKNISNMSKCFACCTLVRSVFQVSEWKNPNFPRPEDRFTWSDFDAWSDCLEGRWSPFFFGK